MATNVVVINGRQNTTKEGQVPIHPVYVQMGQSDRSLDAIGNQKVVQDFSVYHSSFTYDISPYLWFVEENGTEVPNSLSTEATTANGALLLTSGTTATDTAEVHSRRHPRYQPDRGLRWSSAIAFIGANNDGILMAGLKAKDEVGLYLKTKGDGELYFCISNNSSEIYEEVIEFPFTTDITKINFYSIQIGVGNIYVYAMNGSTGLFEIVHNLDFPTILAGGLVPSNLALPASFYAENTTEEVSLVSRYVDISSEGGSVEREQYGEAATTITVSSGDGILAIRSPKLIGGKINTRDLKLARLTIASNKKATVKAYRTRDPAAVTGGTWASIGGGSYVEQNDTMTSVNTGLMGLFTTMKVTANGENVRTNPSENTIDFYGIHGDIMVLVCESGASAEIEASIEWGEEI